MLINQLKNEQENILIELSRSLNISKSQYDMAVQSYRFVAEWLAKEDSSLASYSPDILPQGSFLLGTIIKPIMDEDELDVDLVCQLSGKNSSWTQYNLKHIVGDRLKAHGTIEKLIDEEGRRCWTLVYSDDSKFHMDILPAIINSGYRDILEKAMLDFENQNRDLSIRITDNTYDNHQNEINVQNWPKSNPFGYAIWFNEIAKLEFDKGYFVNEAIQPLPEYNEEKLPLQRVIQILKRHRDIMFGGDEHKPISIIITTLAAKSYKKETSIVDALNSIVFGMRSKIEERYDQNLHKNIKWIGNPLNLGDSNDENFADKWSENALKEVNFYAWLDKLESDFESIKNVNPNNFYDLLKGSFGTRSVNEAFSKAGYNSFINESFSPPAIVTKASLSVPWRAQPLWNLRLSNTIVIHARYRDQKWKTLLPNKSIPKGCDIEFSAITNVSKPFEVYWQIVNTGNEMGMDKRGNIFKPITAGAGGLKHSEKSMYTGVHWAECFIVKDNICVARSSEFFVIID
jgi:hypothetical protein